MRGLWRAEIGRIEPGRFVFVDEMGVHTSLASLYAYDAPIGERAFFEVPRNRGKNTTLLASLHAAGTWDLRWPWKGRQRSGFLRPTWSVCETYVQRRLLVPALEPGQIAW